MLVMYKQGQVALLQQLVMHSYEKDSLMVLIPSFLTTLTQRAHRHKVYLIDL